ncbi:MAG: hypothetical protein HHJ17_07510 [Rhodoferax sp.]|uniref:hypothetical protein n=1 Tax=Rhodoferax sp. TaxID=50421 RepID=UPI0017BBB4C2|nr:hypothetical protein [Rhodoferax sp.]NMM13369.1 hypothetical protein [Rhodoferax sp.]
MTWYVNDSSLSGQYIDATAFLVDLKALMQARRRLPELEQKLFCSRELHTRPVTPTMDFREAVKSQPSNIPVRLVLAWLTKYGPFWEDIREFNQDDYFELNGADVTDLGIGEAARSQLAGRHASSFSFAGGGFDYTPIDVEHGLPEAPLGTVHVPNIWDTNTLCQSTHAIVPAPVNWVQMLEQAQGRFDNLVFSPQSVDSLRKEPFSNYVVERVFALLTVLQEFVSCLNEDGSHSARNHELIAKHFAGAKAWFTDESETNKKAFRDEMSFPQQNHEGEHVFCSWHGKIKTPQYRIHFQWPLPLRSKLRVFYIGPKITKN